MAAAQHDRMTARWHEMLSKARSLQNTTVRVAAKPTNRTFQLHVYESPNRACRVGLSLEPGVPFRFVEVCESADRRHIAGRIQGIGWVNLAHLGSLVDDERPTWYIHWSGGKGGKSKTGRKGAKEGKGGNSKATNAGGKGRKGQPQ